MASKIIINLDTSRDQFVVTKCKQNDDITLEAYIYENGAALDLSSKSITIQALKADKTYIIQNTNITKENNKIIANLDRDFTRAPGKTEIEIVLVETGKQNTTFSFSLEVIGSVIRGAVESSNTVTILEELDNKIVEAGQVKEETEHLIATGGAATTGDIQQVNAQLETNANKIGILFRVQKSLDEFPIQVPEVDDTARIQRAIDACYDEGSNTPSVLRLTPGLLKISNSLIFRAGVNIIGSGTMMGTDGTASSSRFGGTTIMMAKDVNKPVFYANTFVHGASIMNLKITQEPGSTTDVSGAHGIHIDRNDSEISGFGELTIIDRVMIEGMGGDGIRFGPGTESQPLILGHISLHRNGGYGINFDGENYGHVRAISIKGDLKSNANGKALIRIANVSGQSNFLFETVGIEADGTGCKTEAILIENCNAPNITINQLDVRVHGATGLDPNASVIRVKSSTPSVNNVGAVLNIGRVVHFEETSGKGYKYLYYDENIESGATGSYILMSDANKNGVFTKHMFFVQNDWNGAKAGVVFQSVKAGKRWSIGAGKHTDANGHIMRINHPNDYANDGEVAFYNGNTTETARLRNSGDFWMLGNLGLGGSFSNPNAQIIVGTGYPEGVVTANLGSIFIRTDGSVGSFLYVKTSTGNTGWRNMQTVSSGTTASRPTGSLPVGFQYFDTTLNKPIWWNGSVWKDSSGTTV